MQEVIIRGTGPCLLFHLYGAKFHQQVMCPQIPFSLSNFLLRQSLPPPMHTCMELLCVHWRHRKAFCHLQCILEMAEDPTIARGWAFPGCCILEASRAVTWARMSLGM